MTSPFLKIFSGLTRLLCIGFVVVAGFAVPEAWKLNETEFSREGTVVYIPLKICEPDSITVDGKSIIYDWEDMRDCHTLEYFINASVASIIFAMAAVLIFCFCDALERCNYGPVSRSSVLGMSLFLTFCLLQASISCWALYSECKYWEDYFLQQYNKIGSDVTDVQTYGDKYWLYVACIVALSCAGTLFLDTLATFFCGMGKAPKNEAPKNETPIAKASPKQEEALPAAQPTAESSGKIDTTDGPDDLKGEELEEPTHDPAAWTKV